jgi:hypothetical protein
VFAHRIVGDLEDLAPSLPGTARIEVVIEPLPIWEPSRLTPRARQLFDERRKAYAPAFLNIPIAAEPAAGASRGETA